MDNNIDPAISDFLWHLNSLGVKTFQSCSGHESAEGYPSACIWMEPDALSIETAERLSGCVGIEQVALLFGREEIPVWEILFAGDTLPNFNLAQATIVSMVAETRREGRSRKIRLTMPDERPQRKEGE